MQALLHSNQVPNTLVAFIEEYYFPFTESNIFFFPHREECTYALKNGNFVLTATNCISIWNPVTEKTIALTSCPHKALSIVELNNSCVVACCRYPLNDRKLHVYDSQLILLRIIDVDLGRFSPMGCYYGKVVLATNDMCLVSYDCDTGKKEIVYRSAHPIPTFRVIQNTIFVPFFDEGCVVKNETMERTYSLENYECIFQDNMILRFQKHHLEIWNSRLNDFEVVVTNQNSLQFYGKGFSDTMYVQPFHGYYILIIGLHSDWKLNVYVINPKTKTATFLMFTSNPRIAFRIL